MREEADRSASPGEVTNVSTFEIVGLVVIGVGFLGLIAYVARHARQWDDD